MVDFFETGSYYGGYETLTFEEVWESAELFLNDYKESGLVKTSTAMNLNLLDDNTITLIYYLLYGRYAGSPHASSNINQFKYKLFSTVLTYAPTWIKKLEIQDKIRNLTEEELLISGVNIMQDAANPGTVVEKMGIIDGVNTQNLSWSKRSKLNAYSLLMDNLRNDVTSEFLDRFKPLFSKFALPVTGRVYETNLKDEEE